MKIVAVVVTFNPCYPVLHKLLESLSQQVHSIVIIDNGSGSELKNWVESKCIAELTGIYLDENRGLASAQNIGIDRARQKNADYVVLFDQDSLPSEGMIGRLLSVAEKKRAQGDLVAVVGPQFEDERNRRQHSFLRIEGVIVKKYRCESVGCEVDSDVVISSGAMFPMEVFDEIGEMVEELFIDQVDVEWCLRAKAKGYTVLGACEAVMHHSLGGEPISILGMVFSRHPPFRHYYMARNSVWLISREYVPLSWKFHLTMKILFRIVFFPLLVSPRTAYFKMIVMGLKDGLIRKMGRL